MNLEQKIIDVPIEDILPNRFQPRLEFNDKGLEELANSIKEHGIIQPLVLRRIDDKYEIIAGERRYKAATIAGLTTVPAIISNIDDNKSAEVAIVENIQRRDLTPIEEARSYKKMLDKGYKQSDLAKKMGISQSAIANKLRLLNLDEEVQLALLNNKISERHARSLLVLNDPEKQKKWLHKIIDERMTVRDLDAALKNEQEDSDESDIPLVKPLDIETIRKEATELPKINEENSIAKKLQEIEIEQKFNPDIVPIDQASNNSKNVFFNFLEDEKVNMNVEEPSLNTPVIDINSNNEEKEEEPEKTVPDDTPVIELTTAEDEATAQKENITDEESKTIEDEEEQQEENTFSASSNNNFGNLELEEDLPKKEEIFDPVNLIETLDPNYEEKQEEEKGIDLKSAITEIRELNNKLKKKGFKITLDESDLSNTYEFTIKIEK